MLAMFGTVQRPLPQGAASILSRDEREDKEYLLGDVIRATLVRMTEFSPLRYVASLMVFSLVVAYTVALQASAVVRQQSRLLIGVPLHAFYWIAGKLAVLCAMVLIPVYWGLYAMTELWGPAFIYRFFRRGYLRADKYRKDRTYCGGHRHGLAA